MALETMKNMLVQARKNHYAVGALNIGLLSPHTQFIEAAEAEKMRVILQAGYVP